MVCDREYVFMFWRKTTVGGEKEGEKKRGVSLSRPSSLSALGKARKNKIIQRVQLAVDDTTNYELFLRFCVESIKTSAQVKVLRVSASHHFHKRKRRDRQTHTHTHFEQGNRIERDVGDDDDEQSDHHPLRQVSFRVFEEDANNQTNAEKSNDDDGDEQQQRRRRERSRTNSSEEIRPVRV